MATFLYTFSPSHSHTFTRTYTHARIYIHLLAIALAFAMLLLYLHTTHTNEIFYRTIENKKKERNTQPAALQSLFYPSLASKQHAYIVLQIVFSVNGEGDSDNKWAVH